MSSLPISPPLSPSHLDPTDLPRLPIAPDRPWLAPLAGWSDLAFRLLCREQGAAVCCTEMISAKGLVYGGRNTEDLLKTLPEDAPLVAQIFGAEPFFMAESIKCLRDRGFEWFDVNMGCSVHKVSKTGSGAALLRDPDQALAVAEAVLKAAGPGRVGFKLRLGWEDRPGGTVFLELGKALVRMGAGWLTLHPRFARDKFSGVPRHEAVAELVREVSAPTVSAPTVSAPTVSAPVIVSGDLFRAEDGLRVLSRTGAAAVMYARGALADPRIFARHCALLREAGGLENLTCTPESLQETQERADTPAEREALARLILRHAELARLYSDRTALLKMRTFVPRYVRHLDGARALRQRLITCTDWESLQAVVTDISAHSA